MDLGGFDGWWMAGAGTAENAGAVPQGKYPSIGARGGGRGLLEA